MIEGDTLSALHAATASVLCGMGLDNCQAVGATLSKVAQIIFADIILSGDNALVIAMAAAGLPAGQRRIAIVCGLALAALMRIVFAIIASILLKIPGILLLGGLLLAWVCVRFYKDLREFNRHQDAQSENTVKAETADGDTRALLFRALATITLADVSMSLDNVIAVAAIAREDTVMLVMGLALAILLMAFCATIIMKILTRFPLLSWAGLIFLCYLTLILLFDGVMDVARLMGVMV